MGDTAIRVDNLWKEYRLGAINHHTLSRDLQSWWARLRGKEDPNSLLAPGGAPDPARESGGRFCALRDVSFEVKQGEILGIIGRNGAGKSTLLKILSQVTAPTRGEVRFRGRIASLLEVGTGFHPELTGRENIFLNGAILGMTKSEIVKRLDEIIAFSEIEQFIDTPVKRYSSGMYVRLAFAVAAHLEPEILIVDEVLAVGDMQFQKKCLGKMEEVSSRDGRTVLFVSHNLAAISALCSTSMLLSQGSLMLKSTTSEVIDLYLSSYCAPNTAISDITNRGGTGNARITDMYLQDANGKRAEVARSGGDYDIVVKYTSRLPLKHPGFRISIYNSADQMLVHLHNWLCGETPDLPEGDGEARCSLKHLPLAQGVYRVNASLNTDDELLDRLERCLQFSVEYGDFYGTGRTSQDLKEIALLRHHWEFTPGNGRYMNERG